MENIVKNNINSRFYVVPFFLLIAAVYISAANVIKVNDVEEDSGTVNVKNFGARGDGITDDTEAIKASISGAANGLVKFPRGSYRITKTIDIILAENGPLGLSGEGGSARIIMDGAGPAFRFTGTHRGTAGFSSITSITLEKERMPLVSNLEIIGKHPKADGLEFYHLLMPIVSNVLIRNVRHGIHLTSRNRNVIISNCHIYVCSGIGIYLDSVNLHQIIISNNHISYCLLGGIKVCRSEVRNFQIIGNDIEYNANPKGPVSADVWFDCSERGSVREGTISGNTIQANGIKGCSNIWFNGLADNSDKIGLWAITGNYIGSHDINIRIDHARGISITGNSFVNAKDRNIKLSNSQNVVVGENVFDHNPEYYTDKAPALGGIEIDSCLSLIISENIIDGAESGTLQTGGAVSIFRSSDILITGCQVRNPKFRGIYIDNCSNILVTKCIVNEDINNLRMVAGVEMSGQCNGSLIRDNIINRGIKGDIVNYASGVVVDNNSSPILSDPNILPTKTK